MKNSNTTTSLKTYKSRSLMRNKTKSLNESCLSKILNSPINKKNTYTLRQKSKKFINLNIKPPKSKRDIPLPTTSSTKNLNNSIKPEQTLTAEISLNSICSTEAPLKRVHSFHKKNSILQKQDEVLELQLSNSRLQNEIMILNEKNNTLNNIINIKSTECDILKNKYTNLIEELKQENSLLKQKTEKEIQKLKETSEKQIHSINSLISITIELCDILLSKQTTITNSRCNLSNNNNECSLDVYDSFNCDEERKNSLIEQIQSLILSKIFSIKRSFNINIDQKEIDKINNWSSISYYNKKNISAFVNTINTNEEISNSISKIYLNSNDTSNEFDLSVSGQFLNNNASPKFNNFEDKSPSLNNLPKKNLLSELKSSKGSFGDFNSNNTKNNENKSNCINILEYSLGDISNEKEQNVNPIDSFADIKPPIENNISVGNINSTEK